MLRKLIQRIKGYRDKRFLKRLERVLQNYPIDSHLLVKGNIYTSTSYYIYAEGIIKDFENGVKGNFIETEYQKQRPKAKIKINHDTNTL